MQRSRRSQKGSHRGKKTNAAHPPIGGGALASLGLDERPIRRLPPPGSLQYCWELLDYRTVQYSTKQHLTGA
jgi:hypothetical protein